METNNMRNLFSKILGGNSVKLGKIFLIIVICAFFFLLGYLVARNSYQTAAKNPGTESSIEFSEKKYSFTAEITKSDGEKIQINNLTQNTQQTFIWVWLGPVTKEKKMWYGAHLKTMYGAYMIKIPFQVINTIKLEKNTSNVVRNTVHGYITLGDGTMLECNVNTVFKGSAGPGNVEIETENILEVRFLQKAEPEYTVSWQDGKTTAFLYNIDNSVIEFSGAKITSSEENKNNVLANFFSKGTQYDIPIDKIKAIIHENPQPVDYTDYYTQFKIVTLDSKEYIGGLGKAAAYIDGSVKIGSNYKFEGSIMVKMPTFKKVEFKPAE
jgi:hypothetical protein